MSKEQKTRVERESLSEKITKRLDIPPDVLPYSTTITIRGRNSVCVCGSTSITLYTPDEIKLSLHKGYLSIRGCRLLCTSYNAEELRIDGEIKSVSFEEE